MSDFDVERFKKGLNNLMIECVPGDLTIAQCEKLMCDFIGAIESAALLKQEGE